MLPHYHSIGHTLKENRNSFFHDKRNGQIAKWKKVTPPRMLVTWFQQQNEVLK